MNTTTDANRWNPTLSHIYTETTRYAIPANHWAQGATCQAVAQTGRDCTRTASHITNAHQTICTSHAASKYTVDCR